MLYKKSFIKLLLLCLKAGRGNWSTVGCTRRTVDNNTGLVTCDCNHLTNFAILLSSIGIQNAINSQEFLNAMHYSSKSTVVNRQFFNNFVWLIRKRNWKLHYCAWMPSVSIFMEWLVRHLESTSAAWVLHNCWSSYTIPQLHDRGDKPFNLAISLDQRQKFVFCGMESVEPSPFAICTWNSRAACRVRPELSQADSLYIREDDFLLCHNI